MFFSFGVAALPARCSSPPLAALSFHRTRADLLVSPRLVHTAGPCARHFWQHIHAISERPSPSHIILSEPQNGQLTSSLETTADSALCLLIKFQVCGHRWSAVSQFGCLARKEWASSERRFGRSTSLRMRDHRIRSSDYAPHGRSLLAAPLCLGPKDQQASSPLVRFL